ncbi:MAG TPA: hypothetical protein VF618_18585 [Thermoanaerobaculia bacterium]
MSQKDILEVLDHLNALYSSLFGTLLTVVTVVLAVVGVALPMLLTWYQNRKLQVESQSLAQTIRQGLEDEMRKSVEARLSSFQAELRQFLGRELDDVRTQMTIVHGEAAAAACHTQAAAAYKATELVDALVNYCMAVYYYLKISNHLNAQRALAELRQCAEQVAKTDSIAIERHESRDIQKFIIALRYYNEDYGNIYLDSYNAINRFYDKLVRYPLPVDELGQFRIIRTT